MSEEKSGLPKASDLLVSASPHIHSGWSIRKIMLLVIVSLLPACAVGVVFFGLSALKVIVLCVAFCVALEWLWGRLVGRPNDWKDMSAALTGLLLAMNLSASIPWWICLIGAFLAIVVGKQIYGGMGCNPFNPALVARVGLLIGFPKLMTTWTPSLNMASPSHPLNEYIRFDAATCATTCATPLDIARTARIKPETVQDVFASLSSPEAYLVYLTGDRPGCLGETSTIALLIGGILLIALKLIKWQTPLAFIGTVGIFTAILHHFNPALTPSLLFHILTGGLILGAFFMATDMVTSPMTKSGALLFGVGCGLITVLIRVWGGFPEGVSFAILIMNALTPLIDKYTAHTPFGMRKITEGK